MRVETFWLTLTEQHANNLEAPVEDRTADYLEEKHEAKIFSINSYPSNTIHHQLGYTEIAISIWLISKRSVTSMLIAG